MRALGPGDGSWSEWRVGHGSVVVTERYAHMRPDLFRDSDYRVLDVSLAPGGAVAPLARGRTVPRSIGYASATRPLHRRRRVIVSS